MAEQQPGSMAHTPEKAPDIQLYLATPNLPPSLMAVAGLPAYQRIVNKLNAGDIPYRPIQIEVTPTRPLDLAASLGKFSIQGENEGSFVGRVHETWPKGLVRGTLHAPSLRSAAINALALLVLPETHRSLRTIEQIDHQLGGNTPAIVYVDQMDANGEPINFNNFGFTSMVQISPEQMEASGALHPYDYRTFHNRLWNTGGRAVIIDDEHLLRGAYADPEVRLDADQVLDDVEETGTNIGGVHASAGRVDSKHKADRDRSQQELAAVFEGSDAIRRTRMGEVMARAYTIWRGQKDRVGLPESRLQEGAEVYRELLKQHGNGGSGLRWKGHFGDLARNPVVAQLRQEIAYRSLPHNWMRVLAVTPEVPYGGLKAYRGRRHVSMSDFVSMHRDIAWSWSEYFEQLRQEYDRAHPPEDQN